MHKSQNRKATRGGGQTLDTSGEMYLSKKGGANRFSPSETPPILEKSLSFGSCPPEHQGFIEENSLENLVYWKLQLVLDRLKIQEEAPIDLLKTIVNHVERPLLAIILRKARGNQSIAARYLGMSRNTLHRRLKEIVDEPKSIKRFWTRQGPLDC